MIANSTDVHGYYCPTNDTLAQNSREGTVMFGYRIQSQRYVDRPHHGRKQANGRKSDQRKIGWFERCCCKTDQEGSEILKSPR